MDKSFDLVFEEEQNSGGIKLKNVKFVTNSNYILQLYEKGLIQVVCIVECSYTVFRKCYVISNKDGTDITLSNDDFDGRVEISAFAYAKDQINMVSSEFSDDYQGLTFAIEKYDIIAINDGVTTKFNHLETEENVAKSIFNITIDDNLNEDKEDLYDVSYESGNKITIYLSREEYTNYKVIFNSPDFKEVFFNMLLVPVLAEALTVIKKEIENEDSKTIDDICAEYGWFYSVRKGYKKIYSKEMTVDDVANPSLSSVKLAQEILGKPLGTSLKKILDVVRNNKSEDPDNE